MKIVKGLTILSMLFVFNMVLFINITPSLAADGDLIVNGNVGIGTTSPAAKLDVEGSGNVVLNAGNVGVGTTAPYSKLDVDGTISGQLPRWTCWMDETSGSRTNPSTFTKSSQSVWTSFGEINFSFDNFGTYSQLFEMKIYAPSATTVTQKVYYVDNNAYFWLNGTQIASVTGAGIKNTTITWNLIQGINNLKIVLNNSGSYNHAFALYGDFFYRYPTLRYVSP